MIEFISLSKTLDITEKIFVRVSFILLCNTILCVTVASPLVFLPIVKGIKIIPNSFQYSIKVVEVIIFIITDRVAVIVSDRFFLQSVWSILYRKHFGCWSSHSLHAMFPPSFIPMDQTSAEWHHVSCSLWRRAFICTITAAGCDKQQELGLI